MTRQFTLALVIAFVTAAGAARIAGQEPAGKPALAGGIDPSSVTVMTQNVYHGVDAEIASLLRARTLPALMQGMTGLYQGYFNQMFDERADALAREIERARPAIVGLQEAVLVRTQYPADGATTPATEVALDYVQMLIDHLASRGLSYAVVAEHDGIDFEVPSTLGFDVRHTDREVILARTDLPQGIFSVSNPRGAYFATNCLVPTVAGSLTLRRSWVAIDGELRGHPFTIISTHLDGDCLPFTPVFQQAQAAELLAAAAAVPAPLLVIGDMNSPAGSGATYGALTAAGLRDPWPLVGTGPGFTCCQSDDIRNPASTLTERIDFVLARNPADVLSMSTVGDTTADLSPSGLWPSDHAGVVATFTLPLHPDGTTKKWMR